MSKISSLIGIATIFFVSLTIISIIFPSLFSSVFGKFSDNLIPYEVGTLGVPVILSNLGLLFFGIIYYKKKLPSSISNFIDRIQIFEIPKKTYFNYFIDNFFSIHWYFFSRIIT